MNGGSRGVFLLGLRGSGKTTLGRALATRLEMAFVDTDAEVERVAGRGPGQILRDDGEGVFRALEAETLAILEPALRDGGHVLALGGGTPEAPGVEALLHELRGAGYAGVWLVAAPEVLARRIAGGAADRPPLAGRSVEEEVRVLSARRGPLYARLADLRFENDDTDLAEQCSRLAGLLAAR